MIPVDNLRPETINAALKLQLALSKPQLRLLMRIHDQPSYVADYYPPGRALRDKGWAKIGQYGFLELTPEGHDLAVKIIANE